MNQLVALPTPKQEEWRYADFAALETLAPERFGEWREVEVPAGETWRECVVLDGESPELHRVRLAVGEGARAELFAVNAGGDYARLEVDVRLGKGGHFQFGGVTIGGGEATREFVTRTVHAEPEAPSVSASRCHLPVPGRNVSRLAHTASPSAPSAASVSRSRSLSSSSATNASATNARTSSLRAASGGIPRAAM